MAVKASTVLLDAATALQDEVGFTRWPLAELFRYLRSGLHELVRELPEAYTETRVHSLVEGTRQTVPNIHAILTGTANVTVESPVARGRALRVCTRSELDRFKPDWHSERPAKVVKHFIPDAVNKDVFWVYPPNDGTGKLELVVSVFPDAFTPTGPDDVLDSYDIELPVKAIYAPALTYYVLHRAWLKDADFAANQQTSNRYYSLFRTSLGLQEANGS